MQVHSGKARGFEPTWLGSAWDSSREARVRLAWMDFYRDSHNVARTCRHFGISRQTFYCWQRRYDRFDLSACWNLAPIVLIADASRLGLFL